MGVYRVLVGKPEGKRPLGRPRRRWVDNIRMDLQEVGCGYMDWIGLAQDRDRWRTLVSAVMNLRVPRNARNFLTSCKPVSFSRRTLHHGVSKTVVFQRRPVQCTVCYREQIHDSAGMSVPDSRTFVAGLAYSVHWPQDSNKLMGTCPGWTANYS